MAASNARLAGVPAELVRGVDHLVDVGADGVAFGSGAWLCHAKTLLFRAGELLGDPRRPACNVSPE